MLLKSFKSSKTPSKQRHGDFAEYKRTPKVISGFGMPYPRSLKRL